MLSKLAEYASRLSNLNHFAMCYYFDMKWDPKQIMKSAGLLQKHQIVSFWESHSASLDYVE